MLQGLLRGVSIAGAGSIAPSALTGLLGWWDASVFSSMSLTGSGVDSINDQSGGGNTMNNVTATPGNRSNYSATGFNGKPGITTDITKFTAFETAGTFPMGTGNTLTAWYVGTNAGASSQASARYISYGKTSFNDNDNDGLWCINVNGTNLNLIDVSRRDAIVTPVDVAISTDNHIVIITIDASGVITMSLDGVSSTLQTRAGNWTTSGKFAAGRKGGTNSTYISATFAEWGVASGFTSSSNVALLYTYLKNKWGL